MNSLKFKGIFSFSFFSIIDKGIFFIIPLLVSLSVSQSSYASFEVILSIAILCSLFVDLGLIKYLPYFLKINSDEFDLSVATNKFDSIILLLSSLFFIILSVLIFFDLWLISSVASRTLFTVLLQFLSIRCRMLGRPVEILPHSIFVNLVVVLLFYQNPPENDFSLSMVLLFPFVYLYLYLLFKTGFRNISISHNSIDILKSSIIYAFPLIVSSFFTIGLMHLSKFIAVKFLDVSDVAMLSLIQRVSMIIQLYHSIVFSFFIKELVFSDNNESNEKIYFFYFFGLTCVSLLCFVFSYFYGLINVNLNILSDNLIDLFLVVVFTFFWCSSSFLEVEFNKRNVNSPILKSSMVSFVAFFVVLYFFSLNSISLLDISLSLALASFCKFVCMIFYFKVFFRPGVNY